MTGLEQSTEQETGDRPVREERQVLMSGPQQENFSSGLQQQDAIWHKRRQLPEINAIPIAPRPPASLTTVHSLPLCRTSPAPLPIPVFPFPVRLALFSAQTSLLILSPSHPLFFSGRSALLRFSLESFCLRLSASPSSSSSHHQLLSLQ